MTIMWTPAVHPGQVLLSIRCQHIFFPDCQGNGGGSAAHLPSISCTNCGELCRQAHPPRGGHVLQTLDIFVPCAIGRTRGKPTAADPEGHPRPGAIGTKLLTPQGSKRIEEFVVGDKILSRPEGGPDWDVTVQVVEEVFVLTAQVVSLRVNGQVIRTTLEHLFWVDGQGWLPAGLLRAGDLLSSHDGRWVAVDEVVNTGEWETVYNVRVRGDHTYFVGCDEWGVQRLGAQQVLVSWNRQCECGQNPCKWTESGRFSCKQAR